METTLKRGAAVQVENVGAWAAGRPSAPGRYGSIDTNGADFLAASELQLAGLAEVTSGVILPCCSAGATWLCVRL